MNLGPALRPWLRAAIGLQEPYDRGAIENLRSVLQPGPEEVVANKFEVLYRLFRRTGSLSFALVVIEHSGAKLVTDINTDPIRC